MDAAALAIEQAQQAEQQLAYEKARQQALLPYRVTRVVRGVVGSSRYAIRLRSDIRAATHLEKTPLEKTPLEKMPLEKMPLEKNSLEKTPSGKTERLKPILIFGEPGLGKDNLAALIHFGSVNKAKPMIQVNCDELRSQDLFGKRSSRKDSPGLLDWLEDGTLLLNNIQDLDPALKPAILQLVETGRYQRAVTADDLAADDLTADDLSENDLAAEDVEGEASESQRRSKAWILMVSEKAMPGFTRCANQQIKVPPLRVRKADIEAQIKYFVQLSCRRRGLCKQQITSAALRRLQSYDFPGNIAELESMVERAISQAEDNVLTEDIFWAAEKQSRRFRFDLLQGYPELRQFLLSPWWPTRINYGFTLWFYPIVVAVLFWGPQTRSQNFALNFFWAWWWPLILLSFPFVGRLWCAVCPFMIYGEVAQFISLKLWPRKLRGWPRKWAERWGGWILYAGFALILLWEELWNLENTAYLSGWLLLIITAGAVICSVLFERRFWCRYLCPIGGMNGLFAKLSMVELRAQQGICSATCNTYHCYKGGPAEGMGQATAGCPVYSHPAQLTDNRNCVLCMTCLKACPHQSIGLNLRPPGIELWTTHSASSYEVALLLLLLGAVFLHRLPELATLFLGSAQILETFGGHALAAVVALFLPGAIALFTNQVRILFQGTRGNQTFLTLAYGYLPLLLFASLAHYLQLGLGEAGQIVPVLGATFGLIVPAIAITAHPAVISFLQGSALCFGAVLSVILTQKISRQPLRQLVPQHSTTLAFAALLWQIIL